MRISKSWQTNQAENKSSFIKKQNLLLLFFYNEWGEENPERWT